ncbi:hypothetical protein EZS27_009162 [termite gut metagenome]|uniref:Uncharacterized protein n=1 Tax=termite gut metagenome TaxID=433724 RepID=A0A5J4SAC2_9ZZZZ
MKKILALLMIVIGYTFVSCEKEAWGDGDPALEHVYFFGFQDVGPLGSNRYKNLQTYEVNQGGTVDIPVQFYSERIRSYDVTVYYYVSGLTLGTDYQIVDESGAVLSPGANGAFPMVFPQAKKETKNIHVKALNGAIGSINVLTFDPNVGAISHPDNITNSKTESYEVRAFTMNYKVTVNIK